MGVSDQVIYALTYPGEFRSMVVYKIWKDHRDITEPKEHAVTGYDRESMRRCWAFLDQTSRSFAMVIKELEGELARVVALFYLVLRALDTIEDDMSVPNDVKLPLLRSFHLKLYEPGWTFTGSGPAEKDRQVLVEFDVIQKEFSLLDEHYQTVIADIARKMGAGMADFAALATPELPVAEVDTIADYDLYCHYVAGLVGEGLSGLFASSGKERAFLAQQLTLSNSMGLLLQKTNIYRDLKEDVDEGRGFWPKAIWGKYGFKNMKELVDPERRTEAQWAANEMVLDALRHSCDALDYLTLLKNQSVFNFVAIPAVMAMATLDACFMNPKIFEKNVKIRKGQAVQIIQRSTNPRDVAYMFRDFARSIHKKVPKDEPNMLRISIACARIEQWSEHHYPSFLVIQNGPDGKPSTAIDQNGNDARALLYMKIADSVKAERMAAQREKSLQDLRDRGILPPKDATEEEIVKFNEEKRALRESIAAQNSSDNDSPPWLLMGGIAFGLIVFAGGAFLILVYAFKHFGIED